MAKNLQTQWDFGDILTKESTASPKPLDPPPLPAPSPVIPEPPATPVPAIPPAAPIQELREKPSGDADPKPARKVDRKVLTVSEITMHVRALLEGALGTVSVTGEITNLRIQSSGHVYFSLKDSLAQLSCVMFRMEARSVPKQWLVDGQKIVAHGEVTVYEARGQYQLRVVRMELEGLGALQAAFEKLKKKLQSEGLFAPERKRLLPKYPARLGIVTSPTGAAIRDILHVIRRRYAALEIVLASCRVQGEGAASEIACAIGLLNDWNATGDPAKRIDLILVARGGGSLEDLWAFNEEALARAVFNSEIPIISGVGHEIDFTICDFVADFRAATPSAAAEIITEALYASREFIAEARANLRRMIEGELQARLDRVQQTHHRLQRCHPTRRLREYAQRVDEAQTKLARCAKASLRNARQKWLTANQRFLRLKPSQALRVRRELVSQLQLELSRLMRLKLDLAKRRLEGDAAKLRLLSPLNVLERGYSITMDEASGKVIRDATEVHPGQTIETQLKNGKLRSVVKEGADL